MNNFEFFAPTEIVFGRGVEDQTGETARKENAKLQKEIEKLKSKKDNSVVMPQSPATGGSAKKMSDLW